jgi:hypothetical protein
VPLPADPEVFYHHNSVQLLLYRIQQSPLLHGEVDTSSSKGQRCLKHHKYIPRRKYWQYWRSRLINFYMMLCSHGVHSISLSSHSYSPFILLTQHFDASVKTIVKTITQVEQTLSFRITCLEW